MTEKEFRETKSIYEAPKFSVQELWRKRLNIVFSHTTNELSDVQKSELEKMFGEIFSQLSKSTNLLFDAIHRDIDIMYF